jgi:hypothetical protein
VNIVRRKAASISAVDNPRLLAEVALDYIKAHPEEWKQGTWRCETAFCFAGHVAISAGGLCWSNTHSNYDYDVTVPGGRIEVDELAQRLLGLDWYQANGLFSYDNTLYDLKRYIDEFWPRDEASK